MKSPQFTARRCRGRLVAALSMSIALAACTPASEQTAPSPLKSQLPPVPKPSAAAVEKAVAQAYETYWERIFPASRETPERARVLLSPFATGVYLDNVVENIRSAQAKQQHPWGHVVIHLTKITVKGHEATVVDCQDTSKAGMADSRTGRLIPGSIAKQVAHIHARLERGSDAQWRVNQLIVAEKPCTPVATPTVSASS